MTNTIPIAGTTLELIERGAGRPLLFLHAGEGLAPERPWLDLLSRRYRVIAPWHPGYGNSPLIDAIDRPTLLLWGAEDRIVTPAYANGWRQAIPGSRLDIIPGAGHFPHWEQPETFVERLSAFVDKNS